jgi:hypothetical protein
MGEEETRCEGGGKAALKVVKGFTRTKGGGVGRLSSVPGRVGGGMTNREMGGGLITKGRGEGSRVGGEGHSEIGGEVHGRQWGKVGSLARWTLVEPGWLGTASGVRAANMAGVNSEGRDFINWHGSPW